MSKLQTLTTYIVVFPVGTHKLPLTVAAASRGEATEIGRKTLRERIGDPTYGNFPISVTEQPAQVGTGAKAVNSTVNKPKVRTRSKS